MLFQSCRFVIIRVADCPMGLAVGDCFHEVFGPAVPAKSRFSADNESQGAEQADRSIQEVSDGLYFPLPKILESVLVPTGAEEIRIEVSSGDWIDTKSAHAWRAKESNG